MSSLYIPGTVLERSQHSRETSYYNQTFFFNTLIKPHPVPKRGLHVLNIILYITVPSAELTLKSLFSELLIGEGVNSMFYVLVWLLFLFSTVVSSE